MTQAIMLNQPSYFEITYMNFNIWVVIVIPLIYNNKAKKHH